MINNCVPLACASRAITVYSVLAGILIVFNPIAGAFGIALLVGIYAILYGVILLVLAFRLRSVAKTLPA